MSESAVTDSLVSLSSLRRLSFVLALIILTYAMAGVDFSEASEISPAGIKLKILRPDLLPLGIVLASVFTTVRFYFYAFMLVRSPFRKRWEIMRMCEHLPNGRVTASFPGPDGATTIKSRVDSLYPRFLGAQPEAHVDPERRVSPEKGLEERWVLHVDLPRRCRVAAWGQDLDYVFPLLVSVLAWGAFLWTQF